MQIHWNSPFTANNDDISFQMMTVISLEDFEKFFRNELKILLLFEIWLKFIIYDEILVHYSRLKSLQ